MLANAVRTEPPAMIRAFDGRFAVRVELTPGREWNQTVRTDITKRESFTFGGAANQDGLAKNDFTALITSFKVPRR